MILAAVAAVTVWRQKTKLSYRGHSVGDILCALGAHIEFRTAFRSLSSPFCPLALVSIPIFHWCESQFGEANTEQLLEPQAVIAN